MISTGELLSRHHQVIGGEWENPIDILCRLDGSGIFRWEYSDSKKTAFKILYRRDEPNMIAAIRFHDEIAQRGAPFYVSRNIADNRDAAAVGDELLEERAGHARSEPEEIFVEPIGRNHDHV